jgi:hypothetical protein
MANPLITVGNELHNNVVTREMTDAEFVQHKKLIADAEKSLKAQAKAKAERQVARTALLTKLGITEQEAQLLLGS